MATYPNARRNKFSDTLYRPNDIKPLDGEVLVDDGAESPKFQQRLSELRKLSGKGNSGDSELDSQLMKSLDAPVDKTGGLPKIPARDSMQTGDLSQRNSLGLGNNGKGGSYDSAALNELLASPSVLQSKRGTDPIKLKQQFAQDRANVDAAVSSPRLPTEIPRGIQADPAPLDTVRLNRSAFDAAVQTGDPQKIALARQQMDQSNNLASGFRVHGGGWAPALSEELNQKLIAMGQPLDAGGSFNTGAEQGKWDRLRASMPAKQEPSVPLPASQQILDEVKSSREMNAKLRQEKYDSMTTPEREAIDAERARWKAPTVSPDGSLQGGDIYLRGKAVNDRGAAMQQQNAEAEKSYNAQRAAQGLAKRFGVAPAVANSMLNLGMVGGDGIQGGDKTASNSVNPHLAALFPDIAKAQMAGDIERQRLDDARRAQQVAVVARLFDSTRAQLQDKLAKETNPVVQEKIKQDILNLEAAGQKQIASLSGVNVELPTFASDIPATALPVASIAAQGPTAASATSAVSQNPNVGVPNAAMSSTNNPSARAVGVAQYNPSISDAIAQDKNMPSAWVPDDLARQRGINTPTAAQIAVNDPLAVQDQSRNQAVELAMNELIPKLEASDFSILPDSWMDQKDRANRMYWLLKSSGQYGDDMIRAAIQRVLGAPRIATDNDYWKEIVGEGPGKSVRPTDASWSSPRGSGV